MSPAAFPAQPCTASFTVAFASVRLQVVPGTGAAPRCMILEDKRWTRLSVSISIAHCDSVAIAAALDTSNALQGVPLNNAWITARADVVRSSHPRPRLAAVHTIGAFSRNKQESS